MAATNRNAKYHALPTSEDVVQVYSEVDASVPVVTRDPPLSIPWDRRVGWTYFLLGCAMLLPWNGA